jgi:hypothetical protein
MSADPTPEQEILLEQFAGLTTLMQKRQQQVEEELGPQRREVARKLRDLDYPVADMAKRAGIGAQAVYKLLQP